MTTSETKPADTNALSSKPTETDSASSKPAQQNGASDQGAMTQGQAPKAELDHPRRQRGMRMYEVILEDLERALEPTTWFHLTPLPPRLGVVHLPRTDVVQKDNEIIVTAELPGVNKDDVHVEVRDRSRCIAIVIHPEVPDLDAYDEGRLAERILLAAAAQGVGAAIGHFTGPADT